MPFYLLHILICKIVFFIHLEALSQDWQHEQDLVRQELPPQCGGSSLCVSIAMQGFQGRNPVDSDVSLLLLSGREEGMLILLPLLLYFREES